jgi:hypothetical protein
MRLYAQAVLLKVELWYYVFLRLNFHPLVELSLLWDGGFTQSVLRRNPGYVDLVDW